MSSTLVRTGNELPNCHLITIVIMSIVGRYFWSGYLRCAKSLECSGEGEGRHAMVMKTAATLLLRRGVHPKVVSEMLGPADISIALRVYAHVTPHMQQAAMEIMDGLFGREIME